MQQYNFLLNVSSIIYFSSSFKYISVCGFHLNAINCLLNQQFTLSTKSLVIDDAKHTASNVRCRRLWLLFPSSLHCAWYSDADSF